MATLNGTAGNDTLLGTGQGDVINGLDGNDSLSGLGGNDFIDGGLGNDTIDPGLGSDNIAGGDGNDLLIVNYSGSTTSVTANSFGSVTNNLNSSVNFTGIERITVTGGSGDDSFLGGFGIFDSFNGGGGSDTVNGVDFSSLTTNISIVEGTSQTIASSIDSVANIERFQNITLGSGNDSFVSSGLFDNGIINTGAGNDTVNPGLGSDNVSGGAGNDLLIVDYSSSATPVTANGPSGFISNGAGSAVSYSEFERVSVTGGSANDSFIGASGVLDNFHGGAGVDTVNGADFSSSVTAITLIDGSSNTVSSSTDAIINIERLINPTLGGGNDTFTSTDLFGNGTIRGGAGDDTINAGLGIDTVFGGTGNDFLIIDYSTATTSVTVNTTAGSAANGQGSTTSFFEFERVSVLGGSGNDSFTGSSGVNDTFHGGAGNDIASQVDFSSVATALSITDGISTTLSSSKDSVVSIERFRSITLGTGNDSFISSGAFDSTLVGNAGNDTINPGLGFDSVVGGAGNDLLVIDYSSATGVVTSSGTFVTNNPSSTVQFTEFERISILAGSSNDILTSADGLIATLQGNAGNDSLTGASAQDSLVGGSGNDRLDGGLGNDTLVGGIGNWWKTPVKVRMLFRQQSVLPLALI